MTLHFERMYLTKRYALAISRGVSAGSENLFVTVEEDGVTGLGELSGTDTPGGENCDTGIAELTALAKAGRYQRDIY